MHRARMREQWNQTSAIMAMIHNCTFGIKTAISPVELNPYSEQKKKKVYVSGEFVRELFKGI